MKHCLEMLFGRTLSASARRILKQKALLPLLMIPTEPPAILIWLANISQYWPLKCRDVFPLTSNLPLWKRDGNWSRDDPRNCVWDR